MSAAEAAPRRVVVVSPHLDDGVFSCGELLAEHPGAVVITTLAGRPPAAVGLTEWDAAAGFRAGDDVVGARREEDREALRILGATPVWLDFCDSQYGRPPDPGRLSAALEGAVRAARPTAVFVPLGLFHSDHALTHEAGLAAWRRLSRRPRVEAGAGGGPACPAVGEGGPAWFLYGDALYRGLAGLVDARIDALARAGVRAVSIRITSGRGRGPKRRAVLCYRSQLRALRTPGRPGIEDAFAAETYWKLAP